MAIRPLTIAIAAAIALVATLVVDASMNREVRLEARDGDAWRVVAEDPTVQGHRGVPHSLATMRVDPNGTLEMRVRFDNGYPWAWSEDYVVLANGREIARGAIGVAANAEGEAAFGVPVRELMQGGPRGPMEPEADTTFSHPYFEVVVGNKHLYGNLALEAPR